MRNKFVSIVFGSVNNDQDLLANMHDFILLFLSPTLFISAIFFEFLIFRIASSFCHHISTILGLKFELRGKEHLEKDQACIIVANHQSSLDILGKRVVLP